MRAPPIQARETPGRMEGGGGEEKWTDSAAAPAPSRKPSAPFPSRGERDGQRRGSRAARRPHLGGKRRERSAAAPSRGREEGAARFDAARCCAGRHRAAAAGRRVVGGGRGGEGPERGGEGRGRRNWGVVEGGAGADTGARSGGGARDVWGMCWGCRVGRSARWPEFEGKRLGRGAQVARLRRGRPIRSPASALWPAAPCRPSPSGPQRGAGRRAASRAPFRA